MKSPPHSPIDWLIPLNAMPQRGVGHLVGHDPGNLFGIGGMDDQPGINRR